jgi:hypothetical protein
VAGFCEHGNGPSGSLKKTVTQLFKEYHAPWSYTEKDSEDDPKF